MQQVDKTYFVSLNFKINGGTVHWESHATAPDEETAAEIAAEAFWAQMDYKGDKPLPNIHKVYEEDPAPPGLGPDEG